jgi:organic radical activating enzyme
MKIFKKNCCDGIYNSFDIHFTSACDNNCAHCVDKKYQGFGINKPDVNAIVKTIVDNQSGYDDVLFLGGEPCLYLAHLLLCIKELRKYTKLKIFVTTSVPQICHDSPALFDELLDIIDGINLSVQHHNESVADKIRQTVSKFDRQAFYKSLPYKDKIRINLNIVKPYLSTEKNVSECLLHYDKMGFKEIKLSEIQHGKEHFVAFESLYADKLGSPYTFGCQTYLKINKYIKTPVLLKRSCFMCEETLNASFMDGIKVIHHMFNKPKNKYGVIYEGGNSRIII